MGVRTAETMTGVVLSLTGDGSSWGFGRGAKVPPPPTNVQDDKIVLRHHRPGPNLLTDPGEEGVHRHYLLLLPCSTHPKRQAVGLGFALADNRHVWHLLHLALTYPVVECLVTIVHVSAEARLLQSLGQLPGRVGLRIRD